MSAVIGLDLSLRCAAACLIPARWSPGDWRTVKVTTFPYVMVDSTPRARVMRLSSVSEKITAEVVMWEGRYSAAGASLPIFVEDYAYGLGAHSGYAIAEMGGAVKARLATMGSIVVPVNMSTARKYLLGKLPRKGSAVAVHNALIAAGCPWESADARDAFVVANYARTEQGLSGIILAAQ